MRRGAGVSQSQGICRSQECEQLPSPTPSFQRGAFGGDWMPRTWREAGLGPGLASSYGTPSSLRFLP